MSRWRRWTEKQKRAWRNRQEIIEARPKLSRRDLMKLGLLTSTGYLVAKGGLSARAQGPGQPVSPPTTPFTAEMPRIPVAEPSPLVLPLPQKEANTTQGEAERADHQRWEEFLPKEFYELHEKPGMHTWHPELPEQEIWGFNGIFPGPVFHGRYGVPIIVRLYNDLPPNHRGFGMPEVTTHLHNGHTPSESDGFPADFFRSGLFKDNHYPNIRAGYDEFPPFGDERESMGTLWYHDHRFDFTSQNVYKGLASMYLLFSERDSGDETNPLAVPLPGGEFDRSHPLAFRLPSGDYDVPIVFADKVFDEDKLLFFDLFNLDGILGDRFTANGVIQPFFKVQRRKYRFRLLNAGPSRFYQFFLTNVSDLSRTPQMVQIANDGNLLPKPLIVQSVRISVAERMDIVVDFSKTNIGDQIYLLNRLKQTSGIGPDDTLETPGTPIIRFDVDGDPPTPDLSQIPPAFYDLPPIPVEALNPSRPADRTWDFVRLNGAWAVNGKFFDPDEIRADPKQGTWETWDLRNLSGGWQHPIHIHFEEFQILTRNGVPPPASEISRKDVVRIAKLNAGESVRVFMRFRDFLGRFPMHCHNTVHEDHAMMIRWQIVP